MKRSRWLLVVAPLLVFFVAISVSAQQQFGQDEQTFGLEELREAIAVQEQYTPGLMLMPSVVGTAVTASARGNGAVIVYLRNDELRDLPRSLDGVPLLRRVIGEIYALKGRPGGGGGKSTDRTAWKRPAFLGMSVGHGDITAGTTGARVVDGSGNYFLLSNNHVLANQNFAIAGNDILQPGPFDGGKADGFATLHDFETIVFSTSANNVMDAAIAATTADDLGNTTPPEGYGTPLSTTIAPRVGMRVMKSGRTTGETKGRIEAINATVNIGYDSGVARFINQIIISPGSFSAGGDSGALIVGQRRADARKPVGLLFAGSIFFSIANPIDAVLTRFDVKIDGN